jgi:hypothetical protein
MATEQDEAMRKATHIITQHHLLSRAELDCSTLVLDASTKTVVAVTVREKHDRKCGGTPETAPRRFSLEINLKTGAVLWDNNYPDMEMRPIPPVPKAKRQTRGSQ